MPPPDKTPRPASPPPLRPASPASSITPSGHHAHVPTHSAPRTGRRILIAILIVAAALAIGFFIVHEQKSHGTTKLDADTLTQTQAPTAVDVVRVRFAPSSHIITLPGEAHAWYATTIYARVSGYLKQWSFDMGDRVKADQVLATIETPEIDAQLVAAKAKVEAGRAAVAVAQANVHFAQVTYQRYKDATKGVVSEFEHDQRQADFESSQAKLIAAQADVNLAQADVDRLNALEGFKQVTAPFAGIITERRVDLGDLVTAGSTASTTPLYTLAQFDTIRVFVDVPQIASPEIKDGMEAAVLAREQPGRTFTGHVAHTSKSIDPASKTLRVEVDVANPDLALMPGTYLEVNFRTQKQQPHLQIPASALSFRTGGPQVALVTSDNKISFRNVTIARDLGPFVEIAAGLDPEDRVALNISSQVADGDTVLVNEVQRPDMPVADSPPQLPAALPLSPDAAVKTASSMSAPR